MTINRKPKSSGELLVVCTGNICRSPMAEYLLRHRLGSDAGWKVGSAGVFAMMGAPASREAVQALAEWKIDLTPHRSRMLGRDMVARADFILVMTESHKQAIVQAFPEAGDKIHLLKSFGLDKKNIDIADPIGQSVQRYRQVRDEIDGAISDFILHMIDRGLLQATAPERIYNMKIAIGSDHGGFELKEIIKKLLEAKKITVEDVGCFNTQPVDYPDYAALVACKISDDSVDQGILICTTGVGMSITANKFPRVRAALCLNPRMAKL
ncbi:MAG: RpiB/LacA/LacB family sugar-phosphate isomerase, partial [Lentisphaerota bacterium]